MTKHPTETATPNHEVELQRTQRPQTPPSEFAWDQDIFRRIGHGVTNMTGALSKFDPDLKESFKQAVLDFGAQGDYVPLMITCLTASINTSLNRNPSNAFDTLWVTKAAKVPGIVTHIGLIRSFFAFWKARNPQAISNEAFQILAKVKGRQNMPKNVLSDDPEKSWLTNDEYEALLACVWHNYEDGAFSTSRCLILLLSMQYARRPAQLSQLKIKDFSIAVPGDISGLSGPVISFPGIKDLSAETGFRDSKFEHHPMPDHLWKLFELQRNEVRLLFENETGMCLTDWTLEKLPIFATAGSIKVAISELTNHYQADWRTQLDHQLFHSTSTVISRTIAFRPNGHRDIDPPLSHRTGQPIVVTATRLRHTRARQLARKGVPLHVLSHWLGHAREQSLQAYYNDPAEEARKLDEAMAPALMPLAMAFAGNLIDNEKQASRSDDPTSRLEFANSSELKNVGNCGKQSFCATTSVPIPCYRCRHFEPLVTAPHEEVLEALTFRQKEENQALRIGGARNLLVPIDLSADILAVQNCIDRCNARKIELGIT